MGINYVNPINNKRLYGDHNFETITDWSSNKIDISYRWRCTKCKRIGHAKKDFKNVECKQED